MTASTSNPSPSCRTCRWFDGAHGFCRVTAAVVRRNRTPDTCKFFTARPAQETPSCL